jgi:hypothetical protein
MTLGVPTSAVDRAAVKTGRPAHQPHASMHFSRHAFYQHLQETKSSPEAQSLAES